MDLPSSHVLSVSFCISQFAEMTAASFSSIHCGGSMIMNKPPSPSCESFEHEVYLFASSISHKRAKLLEQRNYSVGITVAPRPKLRVFGVFGDPRGYIASTNRSVQSSDNIFVRHGANHTQERTRRAIFVIPSSEIEASLPLQESCYPGQFDIIHTSSIPPDALCYSGDLNE